MAVEASHITLFPPPIPNRDMIFEGETEPFPAPVLVSRKRSRDSSSWNPQLISALNAANVDCNVNRFDEFRFFGDDMSSEIYRQQVEIDHLIAHHTEKVRTEIEQMRRQNSKRLVRAIQEGITERLKTKEEEILKLGQMNFSLEENLKSLIVENQILKEMVQTNEATANALRNKLQLVLAQVQQQDNLSFSATAMVDDAQSVCGSNDEHDQACDATSSRSGTFNRWCRTCGKGESCVLLLPCRHLCVCTSCVSSVNVCPVCNSAKSACVLVNMS